MPEESTPPAELTCSAKDCQRAAVAQVIWNNPKIHTPDREKIWLACPAHEPTLRDFLARREFYRRTEDIDDPA